MARVENRDKGGNYGRILIGLAVAALITVIAVGAVFLSPRPQEKIGVNIKPGSSSGEIAETLADKGVVRNAFLFKLYLSREKVQNKLQAGEYEMETGMTFAEALDTLLKGPIVKYYRITTPEGMTVEQTAETVAASSPITKEAFLAAAVRAKYDYAFLEDVPEDSLEGFLFPKTYTITDETTAEDLVRLMLRQFEKETKPLDMKLAGSRGLTTFDVVIVASIIEKEVKLPDERPLVAAVIYNRLDQGMYLQMCATVQYCLPEYKEELTYEDLEVESPYNTYKNPGLPPGPIASPGLASIKAALNPAPVDYLYYVLTGEDGSHTFTSDYAEFERVKAEQGI